MGLVMWIGYRERAIAISSKMTFKRFKFSREVSLLLRIVSQNMTKHFFTGIVPVAETLHVQVTFSSISKINSTSQNRQFPLKDEKCKPPHSVPLCNKRELVLVRLFFIPLPSSLTVQAVSFFGHDPLSLPSAPFSFLDGEGGGHMHKS